MFVNGYGKIQGDAQILATGNSRILEQPPNSFFNRASFLLSSVLKQQTSDLHFIIKYMAMVICHILFLPSSSTPSNLNSWYNLIYNTVYIQPYYLA